jgi:UDP-N-acetylmuramoyl-L-alanyl-D-glutamate--2,6-diaminopimelate ligase
MGQIAHALADHVIVTDDNPRSENPASIRQAILAATPNAEEVGDRHEAIRKATGYLKAGDVLVIAGKGHEPGQIFADRTDPFDDFKEASTAIKELSL